MKFRPEIFNLDGEIIEIGPTFYENEKAKAANWLSKHITMHYKNFLGLKEELGTRIVQLAENDEDTRQLLLEQNGEC